MNKTKPLLALILLIIFSTKESIAQLELSDSTAIHEYVSQMYENGEMHGGILIAEGETIIYQNAFGMADLQLGIPNRVNHRIFSASIGKMFTAVMIMQLVEEGKLALEDPITKHLPWFTHEKSEQITIHYLLSHRTGLVEIFSDDVNTRPDLSNQRELLEKIAGMETSFDPGTAFMYSNTGYTLLGEVIMTYRGDDYDKALQELIFEPSGMTQTYWSRLIYGPGSPVLYLRDGSPRIPGSYLDFTGPGAEKTTLKDMHAYMLSFGSDKLLKSESWEMIMKAHSLPSEAVMQWGPHRDPYGYGVSILDLPYEGDESRTAYGHGGTSEGVSCYLLRYKDSERIVVFWNNKFLNPVPFGLYSKLAELSGD